MIRRFWSVRVYVFFFGECHANQSLITVQSTLPRRFAYGSYVVVMLELVKLSLFRLVLLSEIGYDFLDLWAIT
jgi:hypothetical protein